MVPEKSFNFEDGTVDTQLPSNHICQRALEFLSLADEEHPTQLPHPISWSPPLEGFIKLNVDAAVNNALTALVVVARDDIGTPIKTWIKLYCSFLPTQAEAAAVF